MGYLVALVKADLKKAKGHDGKEGQEMEDL